MTTPPPESQPERTKSDIPFYACFGMIAGIYLLLIAGMLVAEASHSSPDMLATALQSREIRYSIRLSLFCCAVTTLLSVIVAVPTAYLLARTRFPGRAAVNLLLDIPTVLPPLVIGICLLVLFQTAPGRSIENGVQYLTRHLIGREIGVSYEIPGIILAQFAVSCALAIRTMQVCYDQISPRTEEVALTLGCTRAQAFWKITFPQAHRGLLAAGTIAWARSLGEFGPVFILAGAIRLKTEVLPTTVFLEVTNGNLEGAVAASLLLVLAGLFVLAIARGFGLNRMAFSTFL